MTENEKTVLFECGRAAAVFRMYRRQKYPQLQKIAGGND